MDEQIKRKPGRQPGVKFANGYKPRQLKSINQEVVTEVKPTTEKVVEIKEN